MVSDVLARWLGLAALVAVTGAFAFTPMFMPTAALAAARRRAAGALRRLRWAALAFAAFAFALDALARLDDGEGSPPRLLITLVARAGLLAWLTGLWLARRDESPIALAPVAALLFSQSAISRSATAGDVTPLLADWAHLACAAVWLGGVAQLALVHAPIAWRADDPSARADLGAIVDRFSPWAMFCVLGLAVTGLAQSAAFVGGIDALWTTAYGLALSAKLAAFAALAAFGGFHQQVLAPKLRRWRAATDGAGLDAARRLRASLLAELAVAVAALLAAGAMIALPPAVGR